MKRLSIEPTFAAWRRAAREALREGSAPESIEWVELEGVATPGAATASHEAAHPVAAPEPVRPAPAIPRELLARLKTAACFRADDRWALLYRILWRWTRGERHVVEPHDPDGVQLEQRVQAVEQETDELVLRTLFRRRDPSMGPPEFVGWDEPRHDLLERAASRFVEGMGHSTWMLATPRGAAFWNGMLLRIGRPAAEERIEAAHALPASAMTGEAVTSEPTEALWLAYYADVVNGRAAPMPLRYWRMPAAGPPLPAQLARARTRIGAQCAAVTVPEAPPVEIPALTPPLREPDGPLATCRRCGLWRNAKQAVAGSGPVQVAISTATSAATSTATSATIMVLGEQPGEYENQHGEPFGGVVGQLLDAVLARAGLERAALYLTYAVKHYKWNIAGQQRVHRTPERSEIEACQYWLEQELTRVAPRVVVTLGPAALKALTGAHINLSEYLGLTIAHRGRLIVPTWHPSYALRTADARLREDVVANIVAAFSRAAALAASAAQQAA
ncbi:DUF4130 domain-containing protein [Paraburkholderia sp.]|uniref:DUF4130 domain-containing protein n=1 Tax=Paraburkholderia sp. TaxID=1926495 RepID=UPI0039E21C44